MININQTTPAGFACLTLFYLQTKNSKILSKIKIPENLYQLDSFKPFHLYLAILCKNLIHFRGDYNFHFRLLIQNFSILIKIY